MTYRLGRFGSVIRISDGAMIPSDPNNADWQEFLEWAAAGGVPDPYVSPAPTQDELDIEAVRAYPKLAALRTMTPDEVGAWVDANVTTLATAKDAIKTLAMAVCILARRI